MNKFKIELLDPQKFISINKCQEITNPIFFIRNNIPTDDGLLSNEIFGISKNDRANIFAYIDLHKYFLHPLVYSVWGRMDRRIKDMIHGTKKFRIIDQKITEDENGSTGIDFLRKNIKNIKITRTDSRKRDTNIEFIKKNINNLFIKQCIVVPAYYRDIHTTDRSVGVGEINKLYNSLLISVRALKETADYGLSLSNATCGRIQELLVQIYKWFTTEPNLAQKDGIIKRSVLSKTTDYASRLVISAPNLDYDRPEDMMVDLHYSAVPLTSLCVNLFPYIIFHLRTYFRGQFSTGKYPYKTKAGKIEYATLKNIEVEFSDNRLKKEVNRFIRGFSNRFIPIQVPNVENKTIYMTFSGRTEPVGGSKVGKPIPARRITWCDLIYIAAVEASKDKHVLITRYPLEDHFGQFGTKIVVSSTKKTEPVIINNILYKHYPYIREGMIGKDTSNLFVDTMQISNLHLSSIGGDYDGDMVTAKAVYTVEANEEIGEYINSKSHYMGVDGVNVRTSHNEAVQAIYSLTKVHEGSDLTDPLFK